MHVQDVNTIKVICKDNSSSSSARKLISCSIGIFVFYFLFGVFQEKITKHGYGEEGADFFTYMAVVVFIQCAVNSVFALLVITLSKVSTLGKTPHSMYLVSSFTYLSAMLTSIYALHYVSFPAQVLGKAAKPIPVMILGVLVAGKRYPYVKYMFVVMISVGVMLFMYRDEEVRENNSDRVIGSGELLLMTSLMCDGLTGGVQDKMIAEHRVQAHLLMYWMNLWASMYLVIYLAITGEGQEFLSFVSTYPEILWQLALLAVCGCVGQHFIFVTVATFGPLTCSLITTTRKFFSILLSVSIFNHVLSPIQWVGTGFVFAGLLLDSIYGRERKYARERASSTRY